MARRLHAPHLHVGDIELSQAESHHARDVLRLSEGAEIELFDDAGNVASARLRFHGSRGVSAIVERFGEPPSTASGLTIAAAVPKGDRAEWMIEKLSELGVWRFIPLATARSVVLPEGKNKRERWVRIATEAAKQSRRAGVMRIDALTELKYAIDTAAGGGAYLSTDPAAQPIAVLAREPDRKSVSLFIGPEGGWTDAECAAFADARLTAVRLTDTILRVETAAVAAAAVVGCLAIPSAPSSGNPGK